MLTCSNTASDAAPIFSYEIIAPLGEEIVYAGGGGFATFGAKGGYGSVGDVGNGEGFGSLLQSNMLTQHIVETQIDYCGPLN